MFLGRPSFLSIFHPPLSRRGRLQTSKRTVRLAARVDDHCRLVGAVVAALPGLALPRGELATFAVTSLTAYRRHALEPAPHVFQPRFTLSSAPPLAR